MFRGRRNLVYSFLISGVITASFSFAFRDGAEPGRTGGPQLSGGGNCAECHGSADGSGGVQLLGVGRRYIPGAVYDLTVRVHDSDRVGAGFELSAETPAAYAGTLLRTDDVNTRFSGLGGSDPNYLTHTLDGVINSVANWSGNGNSVDYVMQWQAPLNDMGSINLFAVGVAINNDQLQAGDVYYATNAPLLFAEPFDADGDGDGDLHEVAALQNCFGSAPAGPLDPCAFVDDGDVFTAIDDWAMFAMSYFDGPTALDPAPYVLANTVRGGLLYDRWWRVNGAPAPAGDHPLYPEIGVQSGSATFRCKECHGWDYKGVDGAYGSGSHFTGIGGVLGTAKTPREIFELLKADPNETPDGHDMDAYGMSDEDIWDAVKFTLEGVIDTDSLIDQQGAFNGSDLFGGFLYGSACASCHGELGDAINFGSPEDPEYLGGLARSNPWEVLHKIRFGQPATAMRGAELLGWVEVVYENVGTFLQTLP